MRLLIALGGNAMTSRDGSARPADQEAAIAVAMRAVAGLITAGHEVVLTHGNGPQVGNLLVKNELAASVVPPVPLDWCVAQTQGTIGFVTASELERALGPDAATHPVSVVVTRTVVDAEDSGFTHPTKPIGRYVDAAQAGEMMRHGQVWEDRGDKGWRRVVASPEPLEVLETRTIRRLVDGGHVVVAAGGGGIPMVRDGRGVHGVEAVIDKDLTAALLAAALDVDALIIATDVDAATTGWGTPDQRPIGRIEAAQLRALVAEGHFGSGSMGPKVEAALRFVEAGGPRSIITSLERIVAAVEGHAGTLVVPDAGPPPSTPSQPSASQPPVSQPPAQHRPPPASDR